jgi:flagellar hook-associated protein 1 FlgK
MTNNIENMLNNELDSKGLQQKLSDFFKASQSLSSDPTNNAYRISFAQAAKNVAELLNNMSSTLKSQRNQAVGTLGDANSFASSDVKLATDELNEKLKQLATINGKIAQSTYEGSANNNLLDQRDALLDDISSKIPLTLTYNQNNTVNVLIGNQYVVRGGEHKLDIKAAQGITEDKPVEIQLIDKEGNVKTQDVSDLLTSGSLKAIIDSGGAEGVSYTNTLKEIDRIAAAFAMEMNKIQTEVIDGKSPLYIDSDGKLTLSLTPLFVTSDGAVDALGNPVFTAENIKFNDEISKHPNLIATARADTSAADYDDRAVGNSLNMDYFNNLETLKIPDLANPPSVGEGTTISAFLKSFVTDLGSKIQTINSNAKTQAAVLSQATEKRGNVIGVDLNEEFTDLIKFQRAYEASARVFNAANEMMQIITQLGR